MSKDKTFAKGIYFKRRESAPDFVIGNLACKVDETIEFLNQHKGGDGWVNLNILKSQAGKPYIELDTWQPTGERKEATVDNGSDLPF